MCSSDLTRPPEAAGRWELPGGKVDPGETPETAVVREIGPSEIHRRSFNALCYA